MKLASSVQKMTLYKPDLIIRYVWIELKHIIWNRSIKKSYSQCGEDMLIDTLLNKKAKGFYIDVGANDPIRFSNTKRFYDKGWAGINIEPNPNKIGKFKKLRPKDINLSLGVARKKGILKFYQFFPDTVSTFSKTEAEQSQLKNLKLVKEINVNVMPLSQIIEEYAKNKVVDFISIDTEGYDMEVLKSADWSVFQPQIICIESIERFLKGDSESTQTAQDRFLINLGYKSIVDNGTNKIYAKQ